jgi:hypothetical protein
MLHIDIETCSKLDLLKVGAHRYATDASTDVRVVCFTIDDGPVMTWSPADPVPLISGAILVAHNAQFERLIVKHVLARYGWPEFTIEQFRCTMRARSN